MLSSRLTRIDLFNDFRGHAAGHNIGGQGTSYQTSCSDKGVFTDGNALEHSDIDAQSDTLLDYYRHIGTRAWIVRVPIRIIDQCVGATHHLLPKYDLGCTTDNRSTKTTVWSYLNMLTFREC